jgi:hypothetical protein
MTSFRYDRFVTGHNVHGDVDTINNKHRDESDHDAVSLTIRHIEKFPSKAQWYLKTQILYDPDIVTRLTTFLESLQKQYLDNNIGWENVKSEIQRECTDCAEKLLKDKQRTIKELEKRLNFCHTFADNFDMLPDGMTDADLKSLKNEVTKWYLIKKKTKDLDVSTVRD